MRNKRRRITFNDILGIPYYVVAIGLIVIPFFIMILYAFNTGSKDIFEISFTLDNFAKFFQEQAFIIKLAESLYIALLGTIATLLISYPLAYLIAHAKPANRIILLSLVTAPMWLNMLLRANALKQVIEMTQFITLGTDLALVVGLVYMFLPFMVLPIYTVLTKIDKNLYESAADLGANSFNTFTKVVLPLSMSGVLSGCMMVFLPAATTLVVPKYLGDGQRRLIGNLIEDAIIGRNDFGYGAAISIILGLIMMGFIYLIKKTDRYGGDVVEKK